MTPTDRAAELLRTATDWDHRIIDATSISLGGLIGQKDDVERLRAGLMPTDGDHTRVACEIAVAFIRWAQDLKRQKDANHAAAIVAEMQGEIERLRAKVQELSDLLRNLPAGMGGRIHVMTMHLEGEEVSVKGKQCQEWLDRRHQALTEVTDGK